MRMEKIMVRIRKMLMPSDVPFPPVPFPFDPPLFPFPFVPFPADESSVVPSPPPPPLLDCVVGDSSAQTSHSFRYPLPNTLSRLHVTLPSQFLVEYITMSSRGIGERRGTQNYMKFSHTELCKTRMWVDAHVMAALPSIGGAFC